MDASTRLYCIFGSPVSHSRSPVIHNACFSHYRINAAYLAFEINDIKAGVDAIQTLNIRGASITIPFKESILTHLDWISPDAMAMGAVNTIVHKNNRLLGYNTDCMAAVRPLKPFGISGKQVCIIGAGGAARAVAYGIHKEGGCLTIVNRSHDAGKKLASKFQGRFIPLADTRSIADLSADIVINTTAVGMHPSVDQTPLPSDCLTPGSLVMDVVYTPLETRFLTEAKQQGCTTIDGLSMFLNQGAAQFQLWTDIFPDIEIMRQAILNGDR